MTVIKHVTISPTKQPTVCSRIILDHFTRNSEFMSPEYYYNDNYIAVEVSYLLNELNMMIQHFTKPDSYKIEWHETEYGKKLSDLIENPKKYVICPGNSSHEINLGSKLVNPLYFT